LIRLTDPFIGKGRIGANALIFFSIEAKQQPGSHTLAHFNAIDKKVTTGIESD
jgi:hypothetical protein